MRTARLFYIAILALFAGGILSGCTTEKTYEGVRHWARDECERISSDPERAACLERLKDDYETFETKRREVSEDEAVPDKAH